MKVKRVLILVCIFMFMAHSTVMAGQWIWDEHNYKWYYRNDNGTYPKNTWQSIDGKWYCFDAAGWLLTNQWIQNKYFVGNDGAMVRNAMTRDGFLVDANGVYVEGSGSAINGRYLFSYSELKYTGISDHSPHLQPYETREIRINRISANLISATYVYADGSQTYLFEKIDDATYFVKNHFLERISFDNGALVYWPEDGDAEGDWYIDIYRKAG